MKLTINGTEIEATRGETVLRAAKRAGIDIPHLCSLDWAPSPAASCRLCVVEVEGNPRLLTSCTLEVTEGMAVHTHTPRVIKARRAIMELLIASHPQDCLSCVRSGDCELATLAGELGVRKDRYVGVRKQHPVDISSPALWRDPNKCVLCGRCVTTCHEVQGVGAIDFVGRGFKTKVAPGFAVGLNVSQCVYCGQCARVCPTGAIVERDQVDDVVAVLADPGAVVVAQVAPAVPATLLEGHSKSEGVRVMLERLAAALKKVGFDAVYDTSFAADVTVMEEASELLDRVQNGGVLPMFTSCSPAWVNYVETHRPDLIPHLSTCKSPQQMAGALIREILPRHMDLQARRLVVVSLMPCTAKKFEAQDLHDVDYVLTTRELDHLWGRFGVDFAQSHERTPLDEPFAEATGAGRLFAGSGGVMEAAVRTAYLMVAGDELEAGPKVTEARGREDVRRFTVTAGPAQLNLAVVNGLGRLKESVDGLLDPEAGLHFVEVMSCPGGCIGGGGQPYDTDATVVKERLERLYEVDRHSRQRRSHENSDVQALYEELLGRPLGEVSHRLLHRTYTDRSPKAAAV
jgi:NADH-quinone oxidoreductase subunit G/NADP-reducing hydrogenase subunit HndD